MSKSVPRQPEAAKTDKRPSPWTEAPVLSGLPLSAEAAYRPCLPNGSTAFLKKLLHCREIPEIKGSFRIQAGSTKAATTFF